MSKVLFTGPSGISCGLGNSLGIISNTTSIVNGYIDLDYAVERRPVIPGESLDEYDKIFVTQQSIASFTAPFAHGMAYCVGECVNKFPEKLYIVYDDWQAQDAFKPGDEINRKGISQYDALLECLWKPELGRKYQEEATKYSLTIEKGLEILCSRNNGLRYLIPVMGNGHVPIHCFGEKIYFCPAAYMYDNYSYLDSDGLPYARRKRHILAALQDNTSWVNKQEFNWPVLTYGVKKLNQPRVSEYELARIYASSWGVLAPPHKKLIGTGWFRVRNLLSAEALSIVIGDKDDLSIFDKGYYFSAKDVEEATDSRLVDMAVSQNEIFRYSSWSKDRLISFISNL